ncbi:MAG: TolC family protein [Panacagrimonas sp.]
MRARTSVFALLLGALTSSASAQAMTLGEAFQRALEQDSTVPLGYAQRDAEAQLGEQERAALRPALSFEATGSYSRSDYDLGFGNAKDQYPSWSGYLRARQALLRLDWSARGERADVRDEMAVSRQEERGRQFLARIALRYLDTLLAEDTVDQAESEARAVRESLADTRKRYEVELVPGTDLKEAQARDDLAQAQLVSARAAQENARDALQEVTGYDRSPLPTLREDPPYPPLVPADVESWQKIALGSAAALTDARHRLQLAQANLVSRRAEALPSADLVGEIGRDDSKEFDVVGSRLNDARISVEISIPLYAGGLNRSRVREAEARIREAEADLRRLNLETERAVRTQFRDVETARAEERAYRRVLESATLAQAAAQAGYDAGTRTITDVLDAKSRVVQARRSRNESGYNLLIRLLILNATTGHLTAEMLVRAADPLFTPR